MKRVACITVINTPNYGTVLQAYALQETVKELGYDYEVLNYYNRDQELKFTFWGATEYMNWPYRLAKKVLYPIRWYQLRKILAFQNSKLQLSKRYKNRESLNECVDRYDAFITGSDQVWNNQEINHFDDAYFLAFTGGKTTLSYAASFGKTYPMLTEDDIEFYKNNLRYISQIGVREGSGQEIVKKTAGRDSVCVCDPVFLLTGDQWQETMIAPQRKGYIFVYLIGNGINFDINRQIVAKAREVAKKQGVKVITVGVGLASLLYGGLKTPTVPEWLGLVKNADFVLTNSFHGTAFSILFKTPFYSFVNGDANKRMNTRIYNLLSYLGLEERIIDYRSQIVPKEIPQCKLEVAEERVIRFRDESMRFLINALE